MKTEADHVFSVDLVHCSGESQVHNSANFTLKLDLTALFTYLKIILLHYFQFSAINSIQIDPELLFGKIIFANIFYYSAYFLYYLWVSLHFLILFMSPTILFQLIFTFIYNTFSKKIFNFNKINESQTDPQNLSLKWR